MGRLPVKRLSSGMARSTLPGHEKSRSRLTSRRGSSNSSMAQSDELPRVTSLPPPRTKASTATAPSGSRPPAKGDGTVPSRRPPSSVRDPMSGSTSTSSHWSSAPARRVSLRTVTKGRPHWSKTQRSQPSSMDVVQGE